MSEPLKGYRYSFHVSSVVQHLFALVFGRSFRLASGILQGVIFHSFLSCVEANIQNNK